MSRLYTLGNHRLLYGSCTDPDNLSRLIGDREISLVLSDPPYGNGGYKYGGVPVQCKNGAIGQAGTHKRKAGLTKNGTGCYPPMRGNQDNTIAKRFYEAVKDKTPKIIFFGGNYFTDFLPVSRGWVVWDKRIKPFDRDTGVSFGHCELLWTTGCYSRILRKDFLWNGCVREGSFKLNPKPRIHPTQKPVELLMELITENTAEGDYVLDGFCGVGSTLIACQETGRICLACEIEPDYIGKTLTRFEELYSVKPLLQDLGVA